MAQRSILIGRYAEASIGGTLLALLFDWKVSLHTAKIEAEGYGDVWAYPVPTVSGWTFTAKGYVVPGYPAQYLKSLWKSSGQQVYFTVQGWGGNVGDTKIFEGTGLPVKGDLSVPMALAEQEFELEGYGPPTTGLT
jgi:hypothetical protein